MPQSNIDRPLVSIIILNYNAGELLKNCIESITKSNYSNYEIIVVDTSPLPFLCMLESKNLTSFHPLLYLGLI